MNEYETETVIRAGIEYKIFKSPVTGLMIVHADDVKIGQTQTLAGARIIRRNHSRKIEREGN